MLENDILTTINEISQSFDMAMLNIPQQNLNLTALVVDPATVYLDCRHGALELVPHSMLCTYTMHSTEPMPWFSMTDTTLYLAQFKTVLIDNFFMMLNARNDRFNRLLQNLSEHVDFIALLNYCPELRYLSNLKIPTKCHYVVESLTQYMSFNKKQNALAEINTILAKSANLLASK